MRGRVLFLSNHAEVAIAVAAALSTQRFHVRRADNTADAVATLASNDYDVFVIDVNVADAECGIAFLHHLQTSAVHLLPRVVVISRDAAEHVSRELRALGICDVVPKPVRAEEILAAVEECLDKSPARVQ